jgi:MFS superfamily sulfate permease-like transporter
VGSATRLKEVFVEHVPNYKKHLKSDLSSGLVVFLIALPLCLGISMASGAPLFAGVIAGIVGGILVGFLSNSQVNVSGPAASVALVIFTGISTLGSYEAVLVSVIVAGVVQIIMGMIGAGTIAYFFPSSMIKGILASIGIMLIIKQIPHSVGYDKFFKDIGHFSFADRGHNIFSDLFYMMNELHFGAIIITIISLTIIILWDKPELKKKYAFFKFFPSALAAVVVSVGLNEIYTAFFPTFALNQEHLVSLPVATSAKEFFSFFSFPRFDQLLNPEVYFIGLSIAFIASLESLLSTEAGDKLDPYKRRTNTNIELRAQGIGNIVSGLIGGLPVTAVIVRTSANVSSGARTKTSTIIHGTIMLVCAITIPTILNKIPLASLSAVLFVVGYKLTSLQLFKQMYRLGSRQFAPFITTVVAVMLTDLIKGIMIGATTSIFIILRDSYKTSFFKEEYGDGQKDKTLKFILSEEVTFLNKATIMMNLESVPDNSTVIIDGSRSINIDDDALEIFQEFKETCKERNINLSLVGLDRFYKDLT